MARVISDEAAQILRAIAFRLSGDGRGGDAFLILHALGETAEGLRLQLEHHPILGPAVAGRKGKEVVAPLGRALGEMIEELKGAKP